MRVVLDTNTLVAATLWNGTSKKIIQSIEKGTHTLLTTQTILSEYVEAMNYDQILKKIEKHRLAMHYSLKKLSLISEIITTKTSVNVCADKDDNKILECAIDGKADKIITYDKHLLTLKKFGNIDIITPEQFLKENNY